MLIGLFLFWDKDGHVIFMKYLFFPKVDICQDHLTWLKAPGVNCVRMKTFSILFTHANPETWMSTLLPSNSSASLEILDHHHDTLWSTADKIHQNLILFYFFSLPAPPCFMFSTSTLLCHASTFICVLPGPLPNSYSS